MRTLVLGGIRSGKSAYAESLLSRARVRRYVATGSTSGDPEWLTRLAEHKNRRGEYWATVETSDIAATLSADDEATPTLVDDLGSWLTAYLDSENRWAVSDPNLDAPLAQLTTAIANYSEELVLVSSEVGLTLVSDNPAGRRYQDLLGTVNAAVAAVVDRVVLVVAGIPVAISVDGAPLHVATTTSPADIETPEAPKAEPEPITELVSQQVYPAAADPGDIDFPTVTPPDPQVAAAARALQNTLTKPPGSLGRLEELSAWAAAAQGVSPPHLFARPAVVVFAGDHGVAADGVSAFPPEVTAQMVANFAAGGAAVNVLARQHHADVAVYDLAVNADTDVDEFKIRRSSGNIAHEDALTAEQTRAAVAAGRSIADRHIDGGNDLLIAGEMGIGNTTPAAVITGLLTGNEAVKVVGRGSGIDDAGWARKTAAVRDAMYRSKVAARQPLTLLQSAGGADIAALAGFLAQAAVRGVPVILDGVIVTAAALLANDLAPGAKAWWVAGHRSPEAAHTMALSHLGLEPIIDLKLRLGEGSGALTALPILQSAVATASQMATFAAAGVSDGSESSPTEDAAVVAEAAAAGSES